MAAAREQFRRVAERYAKSRTHADQRFLERIVALSRPSSGSRVLDLATGPGFVGTAFAEKGLEVVGTDITIEMLHHARQRAKQAKAEMDLVVAEATHQPFRNGTFDVAVSRLAFHHMKDPARAVEAMKALVKPGGRVVVADLIVAEDDEVAEFHNMVEKLRDPSHVKSLKLSEWKNLFQNLGLPLERVALSKVRLELTEWAERAEFPKKGIPELANMLEKGPVKARRALSVFHQNGLLFFLNTRAILVGTKQQKPSVEKAISFARRLLGRRME